jgi:hypothetical protein
MNTPEQSYRELLTEGLGHSRDAENASQYADDETRSHVHGYNSSLRNHRPAIERHQIAAKLHGSAAMQSQSPIAMQHHEAKQRYHLDMAKQHQSLHKTTD